MTDRELVQLAGLESVPAPDFVDAVIESALTKLAATPEPPPRPGRQVVLDDLVVALRERSDFGLRKYGTRLETFNGRDPHLDALQELLDLFVYAHQAHMERAELERENAALRAQVAAACCGKGGCST